MKALDKGATNARTSLPFLQACFDLSESEMNETIPSGTRERVFDRADWAIFHLMKAGLIDRPKRGFYVISAEGAKYLASGATEMDRDTLRQFPKYIEFKEGRTNKNEANSDPLDQGSPLEAIDAAMRTINSDTSDEIRALLAEVSPFRFERIVVDLLKSMGFGGGRSDRGFVTKSTGDGGIDGIIHEDALGLDAVYVQAKRYALANKVSRPDIQRFVGSLTGESATKGVFVTTSDFSAEARAYVDRVQQRVVLIDGQQLAQFMIDYEVGVRARKTYVIRSIDEDYFAPDT